MEGNSNKDNTSENQRKDTIEDRIDSYIPKWENRIEDEKQKLENKGNKNDYNGENKVKIKRKTDYKNISKIGLFDEYIKGDNSVLDKYIPGQASQRTGGMAEEAGCGLILLPIVPFSMLIPMVWVAGLGLSLGTTILIIGAIFIASFAFLISFILVEESMKDKKSKKENGTTYREILSILVNPFKKLYYMNDGSLRFGYELIDLDKTEYNNIAIDKTNIDGNVKYKRLDRNMSEAVNRYRQQFQKTDVEILKILETCNIITEHKDNLKTQQHYQDFLDKQNITDTITYKGFKNESKMLDNELKELGDLNSQYKKENEKIVNRIKGIE